MSTLIDKKTDAQIETYRKTTKLSFKTKAHLETLKKYYKVDMEKRIITVPLHFKNVNELIDPSLGSKQHPYITREVLNKLSDIAHTIPYEFKIDVDLKIDDYGGYNHNDLTKSIIDCFELFQYDVNKEKNLSNLKVAGLIIFGVIIFAFLFYIHFKGWVEEGYNRSTIYELVYTVAAVVIWEALYIIFLPTNSYKDISNHILFRVNKIRILDKASKVLDEINGKQVYHYIKVETRSERRARMILLIAGTTILCLAGCKICDVIEVFLINNWTDTNIVKLVLLFLTIIVGFFAGIGAISYYRDKGPFKNLVFIFAIAAIAISLVEIIFVSIRYTAYGGLAIKALTLGAIILVISIVYLVCITLLRVKKNNKKLSNKK